MLSQRKNYESQIYQICKTSGDVNLHEHFKGVRFFVSVLDEKYYKKAPCTCIGKIGNSERIFLTNDQLCYFSVTGGWGEKDGYLVALNLGFEFKHDTPMGINELRAFVTNPPEAHGFASHMKRNMEIGEAKKIISVLEKLTK